jgi:hypothetical protein
MGQINERGKPHVIVVREGAVQSLLKDAGTFVTIVAVIGTGKLLESSAMQWMGFVMLCLFVLSFAIQEDRQLTVAEARARLDEIEREQCDGDAA